MIGLRVCQLVTVVGFFGKYQCTAKVSCSSLRHRQIDGLLQHPRMAFRQHRLSNLSEEPFVSTLRDIECLRVVALRQRRAPPRI